MHKKTLQIQGELEAIRKSNRGVLLPEQVVKFAKNSNTALHSRFDWSDRKAAHKYRLWQAREVINVYVTVLEADTEPVKVYVSLYNDRKREGGGYRALRNVMRNPKYRQQLFEQAEFEMQIFRQRYQRLLRLRPIFEASDKVFAKKKKKKTG